jgi:hypothetical protein
LDSKGRENFWYQIKGWKEQIQSNSNDTSEGPHTLSKTNKEQSYCDIWAGLRPDRPFKRTEGTLSDGTSEGPHTLSKTSKNKAIVTFGLGFAQTDLSKELKAHSLMILLKAHMLAEKQWEDLQLSLTSGLGFAQPDLSKELKAPTLMILLKDYRLAEKIDGWNLQGEKSFKASESKQAKQKSKASYLGGRPPRPP